MYLGKHTFNRSQNTHPTRLFILFTFGVHAEIMKIMKPFHLSLDTCEIKLKNTSHGKGKQYFKVDEYDCEYYYEYGTAKKFDKKRNPCTNVISRCVMTGCLSDVWKYNLEKHFEEKHEGAEFPPHMVISTAEKKYILLQ